MSATQTTEKKPAVSKAEEALEKAMAEVHAAVEKAPPHLDLYAACEAVLRIVLNAPPPPPPPAHTTKSS